MKNIIVCCDGTSEEHGKISTNVVRIYSLIIQDDQQIGFYDPGVGTGGWGYDKKAGGFKKLFDKATGTGLQKNVEDAYRFLMSSYEDKDEIYLFGFSRGAFTVRSLAGMLHKCGLLRKNNYSLVEYASKIYNTKGNAEIAAEFKERFSRSCPVHFIGVWDTVEILLMKASKRWHDSRLNPEVKYGYQALAIDEKRRPYRPSLWDESLKNCHQKIEQVWFAGVHSDIGGGYKERGLPNITLHWMVHKAMEWGMRINEQKLSEYKLDPNGVIHESYKGVFKFSGKHIRKIPEGSKVHKSVKERITNKKNKYEPKNLPSEGMTEWVP